MNKIVSTSLVAREYEKDVLLCKLYSEYLCVDEFIFIESAYDTHGNFKGLVLEKILQQDQFKPFLDKITILSNEKSFYPTGAIYNEQNNLLCEFNSRAHCWQYIQQKYDDDTWVIAEDADEMLDFSDSHRRDILLKGFRENNKGIQWQNLRYFWDFDNLNLDPDKYIPCHKVGFLKELEHPFHHRNYFCTRMEPSLVCGVEYSHCFFTRDNWIKVNTSAHDKYQEETMERAYQYNTFHSEPQRGEKLRYPLDFFENVVLDESNSTKFVRDNLSSLRVNTVNPAYATNRVNLLGINPHPCEQSNKMRGCFISKNSHYYRKFG